MDMLYYSLVDGNLDYFHFLYTMNIVAVNICVSFDVNLGFNFSWEWNC